MKEMNVYNIDELMNMDDVKLWEIQRQVEKYLKIIKAVRRFNMAIAEAEEE